MGTVGRVVLRSFKSVDFINNCYGFSMYSPNAKSGSDQCCSGEGYLALTVAFVNTHSDIILIS